MPGTANVPPVRDAGAVGSVALRVMGPLVIERDGAAIPVGGRMRKRLLSALSLDAPATVSVTRLAEWLWNGAPPRTATKSIQMHVASARDLVGTDAIETVGTGAYRLAPWVRAVDVDEFEHACRLVDRAVAARLPDDAAATAASALTLWRGTPWADLDAVPDAIGARARLAGLRDQVRSQLLAMRLARGEHAAVSLELRQLVRSDPDHEHLWALLVVAEYRSGRRRAALRAYDVARRHFASVAGLEPGPILKRLQDRVIEDDPQLWVNDELFRPQPFLPPVSPPRSDAPVAPPEPAATPPLVGRDHELRLLAASWAEVSAGHRRSVLLRGEPGSGKSALVRAFRESLPPMTALALPLGSRRLGAPRWRLLLPSGRGDAEAMPDSGELPTRSMLVELAAGAPILLELDDLDDAEPAELAWVGDLLADPPPRALMLAATTCATALSDDPRLGLPWHTHGTVVDLGGLGPADCEVLARRLLGPRGDGGPPGEAVGALLHELTGGNPLLVHELVNHRWDDLRREAPERGALVTPIVAGVFGARLRSLPEETLALLAELALTDPTTGHRVAARRTASAPQLLEPAVTAHVVAVDQLGTVAFTTGLVREVVRSSIAAAELHHIHQRIARLLAADGDPATAGALAEHAWRSAAVDPAFTLTALRRSAEAAIAAGDGPRAVRDLERALDVAATLLDLDPASRAALDVDRGLALREAHDGRQRQALLDAGWAASKVGRVADVARAAIALTEFGAPTLGGDPDADALALVDQALAGTVDVATRARLLAARSNCLLYSSTTDDAVACFDEAEELARGVGDPTLLGWVLRHAAVAATTPGSRVGDLAAEAVLLGQRTGDAVTTLAGHWVGFGAAMGAADRRALEEAHGTALSTSARIGDPTLAWFVSLQRVDLAILDGQLPEAEAMALTSRQLGLRSPMAPDVVDRTFFLKQLQVLERWGRAEELRSWISDLSPRARPATAWPALVVHLLVVMGELGQARELIGRALPGPHGAWTRAPVLVPTLCEVAPSLLALGEGGHAAAAAVALEPFADQIAWVGGYMSRPVALALGELALTNDRTAEALRWFDRAEAVATRIGSSQFASEARARRAAAEGRQPSPEHPAAPR